MAESDKNTFNVGDRYEIVKNIGSGAYGVVTSALDKNNKKEKVAIKKLNKLEDIIDAKRILREIRILRCLTHDNIL
jgi:mitogen-activated protein kinase 1/3